MERQKDNNMRVICVVLLLGIFCHRAVSSLDKTIPTVSITTSEAKAAAPTVSTAAKPVTTTTVAVTTATTTVAATAVVATLTTAASTTAASTTAAVTTATPTAKSLDSTTKKVEPLTSDSTAHITTPVPSSSTAGTTPTSTRPPEPSSAARRGNSDASLTKPTTDPSGTARETTPGKFTHQDSITTPNLKAETTTDSSHPGRLSSQTSVPTKTPNPETETQTSPPGSQSRTASKANEATTATNKISAVAVTTKTAVTTTTTIIPTTTTTTTTAMSAAVYMYIYNKTDQKEDTKHERAICQKLIRDSQEEKCELKIRTKNGKKVFEGATIQVSGELLNKYYNELQSTSDNTTLVAILCSCAALLAMIIGLTIYAMCHRRSYRKDQQHLTEELQTVENGYHDNPTLEVTEVQPEMQEKKATLIGEFNDSWIVPIDNLAKDDIPDEEDTHL
ncbi:podocalyxin [Megalops cyprinoides]|uniref:podocalyxin n=1 Tax=Megalops cyprinoides TaxID=118141 RepID=UPI001864B6A8|nr:podocalyxin [Megalops cyprinoides]